MKTPKPSNILPFYSIRCQPAPIVAPRILLPIVITTRVSFEIADSELRDFQAYLEWANQQKWHRAYLVDAKSSLITAAMGNPPKPFNKPASYGVPSKKAILARARKLMKRGRNTALKIEISLEIRDKLQATADHYGISLAEICQTAIGYHAALWRRQVEKSRPKTPFDRFERSLRKVSSHAHSAQKSA